MTGRILQAQKLATSFDPFEDERPARAARPKPSSADAVEAGAMAIYGVVTRTEDPDKLLDKWDRIARPKNKDAHRAEAEACLRAAGRIA